MDHGGLLGTELSCGLFHVGLTTVVQCTMYTALLTIVQYCGPSSLPIAEAKESVKKAAQS